LTDFRNFSTAIYNNELRNKNLLKFSPHLKSVAALPCVMEEIFAGLKAV